MLNLNTTLTVHERAVLDALVVQADETVSRRAKAILQSIDDPDLDRVAAASGLRPAQARYWIRAFSQSRLNIFSPDALEPIERGLAAGPPIETSLAADAADQDQSGLPHPQSGDVGAAAADKKARRSKRFGLQGADPMPEACRRIMAFHFERLRKLEPAAAEGDEEAIHDMRVAIRRLRAAFRIAQPYYKRKTVRAFRTDLRDLADRLGAVRDLDVILNHGLAFAHKQAESTAPKLDVWLDHLRQQRAEAQRVLIHFLAGKRFAKFAQAFEVFVAEPEPAAGDDQEPGPARVCDVIPAAIWTQYSTVRAYETRAPLSLESLHALRIEFKRLRYLLEFFREVLGGGADALIASAVRAQDQLGLLHDADVAAQLVGVYLGEHTAGVGASDLAAMAAYLSDIQLEIQTHQGAFQELWQEITSPSFRGPLAKLLGKV